MSTSPPASYRVEMYRLGWYGEDGARLVACLPDCAGGTVAGQDQGIPAPDPVTLEVKANWTVDHAFIVPTNWESGYYLANFILTTGPTAGRAHFVPIIIRAEASRNAAILVEAPTNTWQAYNAWGGHSLYDPAPADKVSYDRPYDGINSILRYEYQLVRFLDREGFDVEFTTNVDVHRDPSELLDHQLVISTGHDEYWSGEMRDGFEAARDAGVNLGFFSSNTAYWQVRFENSERTMVGYKVKPNTINEDPEPDLAKKSMRFRELTPARPECELIGAQYQNTNTPQFSTDESSLEAYTVATAALADPWFASTGIIANDVFPNIVGYEWDQIVPGCRPVDPEVLFQYTTTNGKDAQATKYVAPSGATVFSTGSMGFNYALDDWRRSTPVQSGDPRLQTFTRNLLLDLSGATGASFIQSSDGNGIVELEAELFDQNASAEAHDWTLVSEPAASGGAAMLASPDIGTNRNVGYVTKSPRLDFRVDFLETGTHYVWVLGRATGANPSTSDSLHVGLNWLESPTSDRITSFGDTYGWSNATIDPQRATIEVTSTGVQTVNVWMREDGFIVDKIVLTTNDTLDIEGLINPQPVIPSFFQSTDGNGIVEMEAESFDVNTPLGSHAWVEVTEAAASNGAAMITTPETGANNNSGYEQTSPRLDFNIEFVETGMHYVWILGRAGGVDQFSSDSVHAGLDGLPLATSDRITGFTTNYGWSSDTADGVRATIDVTTPGVHRLNLWMREDAFIADKIVLTTNSTLDIEGLINPEPVIPSFFQSTDGNGIVEMEAESFNVNTPLGAHAWVEVTEAAASNGAAMITTPETGANNNSGYEQTSPRLDFDIEFVETGMHYVWILGRAGGVDQFSSDSVHAGLDGLPLSTSDRITGFNTNYGWSNNTADGARATIDVTTPGVHRLNLWMREDAFIADKIVLTTNSTLDITGLLNSPPALAFAPATDGLGRVNEQSAAISVAIAKDRRHEELVDKVFASNDGAMPSHAAIFAIRNRVRALSH